MLYDVVYYYNNSPEIKNQVSKLTTYDNKKIEYQNIQEIDGKKYHIYTAQHSKFHKTKLPEGLVKTTYFNKHIQKYTELDSETTYINNNDGAPLFRYPTFNIYQGDPLYTYQYLIHTPFIKNTEIPLHQKYNLNPQDKSYFVHGKANRITRADKDLSLNSFGFMWHLLYDGNLYQTFDEKYKMCVELINIQNIVKPATYLTGAIFNHTSNEKYDVYNQQDENIPNIRIDKISGDMKCIFLNHIHDSRFTFKECFGIVKPKDNERCVFLLKIYYLGTLDKHDTKLSYITAFIVLDGVDYNNNIFNTGNDDLNNFLKKNLPQITNPYEYI